MRKLTLIAVTALLMSCANPSMVRVKTDQIAAAHIRSVYIPRFEGNPEFVEESTDLFVTEVESMISARVIQGPALRLEGPDIAAGGNIADTDVAVAAARKAGAQAVVLGKVTSYRASGMLNGFSTVRVIDTQSGSVIASFHRPSGMLIGNSEHQAAMAAVKRTAEDVSRALK